MGLLSTLLLHPNEISSMLRVRQLVERAKRLPQDPDLAFCYDMLNRVSRSFAVVIPATRAGASRCGEEEYDLS